MKRLYHRTLHLCWAASTLTSWGWVSLRTPYIWDGCLWCIRKVQVSLTDLKISNSFLGWSDWLYCRIFDFAPFMIRVSPRFRFWAVGISVCWLGAKVARGTVSCKVLEGYFYAMADIDLYLCIGVNGVVVRCRACVGYGTRYFWSQCQM